MSVLERNLAAMEVASPEAAAVLRACLAGLRSPRYALARAPDGVPVVVCPSDASRVTGGAGVGAQLATALRSQSAIALAGVGDGRVLPLLTERPTGLHGARPVTYLCEPDAERLLAAMSVHDLTGAAGPFSRAGVEWFVGDGWAERYRSVMLGNLMLMGPNLKIALGVSREQSEGVWDAVLEERRRAEAENLERATAWSATHTDDSLRVMFGLNPPRRPRVMLMTARFTSVLRYSIEAAARGFRAMGWDAVVVTESRDHERLNVPAIIAGIARHQPDVLFTANYLRHQLPPIPEGLPFITWILDDVLDLINKETPARMGPRDFITGPWVHRYVTEWGYPADRAVVMPRLTEAVGVMRKSVPAEDLVYVSSHAVEPTRMVDALVVEMGKDTPEARTVRCAGREMIDAYGGDSSVPLPRMVRALLEDAARAEGMEAPDAGWLARTTELLCLKLNNPLFRQQGLNWAAQVARERGLTLGIYGPGWDKNPRFAAYARGPVAYGDDLVALSRAARFNLRLEPYPPMCHQRLIDLCAAGAMTVSRRVGDWEEPEDRYVCFFLKHLAGRAADTNAAMAMLGEPGRTELRACLDALAPTLPRLAGTDLVSFYQERLRVGTLVDYQVSPLPPRYFETVFGNAAELGRVVDRFTRDETSRLDVMQRQHAAVMARHEYSAGLRRLMSEVRARIGAAEPAVVGGAA